MARPLVYVAGPISRGCIVTNCRLAFTTAVRLMAAGITPVVPHGSCFWGNAITAEGAFRPEALPHGTAPEDWYEMDLELVRRCDAVLRLPGLSRGADLEVAEARERGVPVLYDVESVLEWARWHTPAG